MRRRSQAAGQIDLFAAPVPAPAAAPAPANDAPPHPAESLAPPPWALTPERKRVLEFLVLLGPSSVQAIGEALTSSTAPALDVDGVLVGMLPYGVVERHEQGWASTEKGYREVVAAHGLTANVESPAPAPQKPRARSADDLGDPAEIAAEIEEDMRGALDAIEGLTRELEQPQRSTAGEVWVVYAHTEEIQPAIIQASSRWSAEREVSFALGLSSSQCFAVPARSALLAGAVPIEQHPDRKQEAAGDLGDRIKHALDGLNDSAQMALDQLRTAHAEVLGCSVEELAAKREEEAAAKAKSLPVQRGKAAKRRADAPALEAGMRELTDRQRELLALVDVDPKTNRVIYTREEHVPDWAALKLVVEALGGKWVTNGKKTRGGWAFPDDVDAMDMIVAARDRGVVLDPKLLGFFFTSDELGDHLVARLQIQPGERVLEPSAGDGTLALAVRHAQPEARVSCVELLPDNRGKLTGHGFELIGDDFLKLRPEDHAPFDVVVANPPFGAGRPEIHHTKHMLRFLRPGGRMAAILPQGVQYRQDSLTTQFRDELARLGAAIEDNPPGAFREAGTMIKTVSAWLTKA